MQRIIQITISGRVIPIEEMAYGLLDDYISSLERQFDREESKDEIIGDIENRIAELFMMKIETGGQVIDRADVQKVIDTLGNASELNENAQSTDSKPYTRPHRYQPPPYEQTRRLYRNPNDKILGGVCSGVANYFEIDPVIVRLVFAILFLTAGIGLLAYILAWIIIPVAKTPQDMYYMTGAHPMDFETIKKNMGEELQDLKKKGEEMSRDLRDFFSNKKK